MLNRLISLFGSTTKRIKDSIAFVDRAQLVRQVGVFDDELLLGRHADAKAVHKFSERVVTTAAAGDETVWHHTTNFTPMETADTFTITYNNATDGDGTTGALALLIDYLDANFELQQAFHFLGNTGSDVTSFTGLGINRVVVFSSGTAKTNTNAIVFADTAGTVSDQAIIPALHSVTQQSIFHMPQGWDGVLGEIEINMNKLGGGTPAAEFTMWIYNRLVDTRYRVVDVSVDSSVENTIMLTSKFNISGRDVVYWTIDTDTNNTLCYVDYTIRYYRTP